MDSFEMRAAEEIESALARSEGRLGDTVTIRHDFLDAIAKVARAADQEPEPEDDYDDGYGDGYREAIEAVQAWTAENEVTPALLAEFLKGCQP